MCRLGICTTGTGVRLARAEKIIRILKQLHSVPVVSEGSCDVTTLVFIGVKSAVDVCVTDVFVCWTLMEIRNESRLKLGQ